MLLEHLEHSAKYLLLCSAEESNSYKFGTTLGWENVDRAEQTKGENMVYFKFYFTADTQFSKVLNALEPESHFMQSVHTFHLCHRLPWEWSNLWLHYAWITLNNTRFPLIWCNMSLFYTVWLINTSVCVVCFQTIFTGIMLKHVLFHILKPPPPISLHIIHPDSQFQIQNTSFWISSMGYQFYLQFRMECTCFKRKRWNAAWESNFNLAQSEAVFRQTKFAVKGIVGVGYSHCL